jgi:hypothetical protein
MNLNATFFIVSSSAFCTEYKSMLLNKHLPGPALLPGTPVPLTGFG